MNLMIRAAAFGVAAACTVVMGFAIQRGATCTVAAMSEVVDRRGVKSLVALVEASVWVALTLPHAASRTQAKLLIAPSYVRHARSSAAIRPRQ